MPILYAGEALHMYMTADDGEQPLLVPVGAIMLRGTVRLATHAVTVSPTSEINYDGNRFLTGAAPLADGSEGRLVVSEEEAGERRWAADITVSFPPQHSDTSDAGGNAHPEPSGPVE